MNRDDEKISIRGWGKILFKMYLFINLCSLLKQNIGIFLLTIVCGDKDLWVVSEALDSLFDVFGEDHLDSIDHDISLTDRLSKFVPEMKSRVSEKM